MISKTAVIGCGAAFELLYQKPLRKLEKSGWLQLVALADPAAKNLARAGEFFPAAKTYTSESDCLAHHRDLDLCILLSPPQCHCRSAVLALSQGSHVFCEKPLASSLQDGLEMRQAAESSSHLFVLGMTRRFYPATVEMKRLVASGSLGKHLSFSYRHGGVYNWPIATASPFLRRASQGGVLLDKGIHAIDQLLYIFGDGEVAASADDGSSLGVEANCVVDLRLERATGRLKLSWDMPLRDEIHIRGDLAELWAPVGELSGLFFRQLKDKSAWTKCILECKWPVDLQPAGPKGTPTSHEDCIYFELVQTLRAIRLGEPPFCTVRDGVAALELISEAYEKAAPLDKPWLPAAEQVVETTNHRHATAALGEGVTPRLSGI